MILVDKKGHMVSTTSADELHRFASSINLKREWYQCRGRAEKHPHYDLTTKRKLNQALSSGAILVDSRSLMRNAWWAK